MCTTEVVQALSSLPHLQQAKLAGEIDAAALTALPLTLTGLECDNKAHGFEELAAPLTVTRANVPALCQLTRLQRLSLSGVGTFHPAVLAALTELCKLLVLKPTISKDYAEPGLYVLNTLTNLQRLQLRGGKLQPAVATAEDYAALTASSGLTLLDLTGIAEQNGLPAAAYGMMFPAGRSMPRLAALQWDAEVLQQQQIWSRVVSGCPKLRELCLRDHGELQPTEAQAGALETARGLLLLSRCTSLTKLTLEDVFLTFPGWKALAELPRLATLWVTDWRLQTLLLV